ncbi:MAG TPA: protein kinase [Bryobacteraceae bacterium]|nr:protein kinase [Bryobacteraceae bacterium]
MNIGERVGDYEVVEILGSGGMGEVYKVRNLISDRLEAMKVLLPNMSSDPDLADRFLREIKVQAALDHPNIARLHTAQQAGNQLVMFMEYVEGTSVEKLLEQGPLGVSASVNCAAQVLEALAYAHGHGVVHRDIKPANIMRTPTGAVKLMDFGIARMQADRRLTQTGHTVGSLYYMSPEQIKGGEPDPRSDLYSLGISLYEMLTGRKPFQGDSDYSIMAAHMQQIPAAPIEVVPGVPPDLSEIVLTAIAKDPAARFQNAAAFRGALRTLENPAVQTAPIMAPPPLPEAPLPNVAPPPPPQSYAAPPPMPAAFPPKPASRRGLYMALGSVATIAVLAIAALELPKYLHARAGENEPASTAAVAPTSTPTPAAAINATPPVTVASAPALAPAPEPAPVSAAKAAVQKESPAPQVALRQRPAPVARAAKPPQNPPQRELAQAEPARTPQPAAVQPTVAPQAPPAQQAAPARPAVSNTQLNDLRKDFNQLSIRASAAKTGLRSIQQQMQRQGLDLRTDILEAQSRLDYLMKEAMDSIVKGDIEGAKSNLEMAEAPLETIEKFLGH